METSGLLLVSVFCNIQRKPLNIGKDKTNPRKTIPFALFLYYLKIWRCLYQKQNNLLYKKESPFMRDFINDNSYLFMVVISKLDFPPILL